MKILNILLLAAFLIGCAEITPPTPKEIIDHPLGTGPLRIGMTKEKIKFLWGNPDAIKVLKVDAQGMVKEEWIYHARYPNFPVKAGYFSVTQHLTFDGDNLVEFYYKR